MRHYGFNFQWLFIHQPDQPAPRADERALDFMVAHGFNFVCVPMDYRHWTTDFDYLMFVFNGQGVPSIAKTVQFTP
jgi:endoglucanase